ncbi:DEAD-domain-containing protein [Acaromyces ingoldii]|uniref:RNA helicase n=1 Tax=Acaromyces ingoldii TaxID=215250 RepID=A0A316YY90_9BASI|nr:DEAD-domain-containing protein [Acaromyces ingoldii]PWN93053.1 DEAD-domain-containing protein [Acaromyces ingoldii]
MHKKEKKRKMKERLEELPASVTAEVGGEEEDLEEKKRIKKAKKEEKKRKREAEAEAGAEGAGKDVDVDDSDEKKKQEKKRAKEEKKRQKKAAKEQELAGSSSSSAAPAATEPSTVASTSTNTNAAAARAYMEANNITIEAPEESEEKPPLPMLSFSELNGKIDKRLKEELDRFKFQKPSPIQACCWPVLLSDKDVVGIAETGSGKTIAFGLPALQHVLGQDPSSSTSSKGKKGRGQPPHVSVLVVAPTRELAIQTHDTIEKLAKALGFGSICLYGGVSKHDQSNALYASPAVRVVVGTPGRVLDLAREGTLDLSNVSYVVLDEADRMLDVGFEPDIRAIMGMTRSKDQGRHTSMFSATWPMQLRGLAESFMNEPMRVTIGSDELSANHRVEQVVEVLEDSREKERRLDAFLKSIGAGPRGRAPKDKVLIFALYKKEAQRVEDTLRRKGYQVAGIHGDLNQHQRIANLDKFKSGEAPLLVATDVAARGIDVPSVEYVVNHTFPLTIEDYVHRIGRTGRAGKTGKSVTFFTWEDKAHAGELMRILRDSNMPVPEAMNKFPATIKRKEHSAYGAHFKELVPGKAKKITFDD